MCRFATAVYRSFIGFLLSLQAFLTACRLLDWSGISRRSESSYGRAQRRARTHTCLCRDRTPANQGAPPTRLAAQFRNLVPIRHRLHARSSIDRSTRCWRRRARSATPTSIRSTAPISRPAARLNGSTRSVRAWPTRSSEVFDMIDTAAGSATSYSASLADASEKLQGASDKLASNEGVALRAVIERLVTGAKEMETSNKKLEARLSASRQEIEQLQQNLETVRTESLTDPLTTLANRKFFDAELRQGHRRSQGRRPAVDAVDVRHRSLQGVQRQIRPSHRRPGIASGRHVGEAERQGPGHRRALRRRGIRRRAAEDGAAIGDHASPTTSAAP